MAMPRLSLSARVIWLAGMGLLVVAVAGLMLQVRSHVESERQGAEDNVKSIAAALLPVLKQTLVVGDLETVQQTLESVSRYRGLARVSVYRVDPYHVLAEAQGKGADVAVSAPSWFIGLFKNQIAPYHASIRLGGIYYGELLIEPSFAAIIDNAWKVSRQTVAASIVSLVILMFLLGTMLRQGLRPLTGLASTVKHFGAGDLSQRAIVSGPPEIASTADAFNQMAASIEELMNKVHTGEMLNRRLALAVEQSNDAVLTLDLDGHIQSWNSGAERLYGYPAQDVLGRSVSFLLPESRQAELAQWLDRIRHATSGERFDTQALTRDARLLDISVSASPLFDTNGKRTGEINISHDITESKAMARALQEAKEQAEAANNAKSQFLANMSHEIRTPMNGILGMTDLVLDSELGEQQREYLSLVKTSAESLLTVLNDILDFSKIEAGRMDVENIEFSPEQVVVDSARLLELRAKEKGLSFEWIVSPEVPPLLFGDPARLRQIVLNLVGNAIKFTEKGGIKVIVTVDDKTQNTAVLHIAIEDSGIGIPPDRVDSIFSAFSQVDASTTRRYGGTGLGLSICSRLAALMGGRIWVESEAGKGSTFHLTITMALSGDTHIPQETFAASDLCAKTEQPGHVLVVEDVLVNQALARSLLEKRGHIVSLASDGEDALMLMQRGQSFDVILMDLQMPGMDGYEATARIREMERASSRHTPIIAVTASAMNTDRERCLALGMDGFVAKPYRAEEVFTVVEKYCGKN